MYEPVAEVLDARVTSRSALVEVRRNVWVAHLFPAFSLPLLAAADAKLEVSGDGMFGLDEMVLTRRVLQSECFAVEVPLKYKITMYLWNRVTWSDDGNL